MLLSGGAAPDKFERVLDYAYGAGAGGFLAGRTIWLDAVRSHFPDQKAVGDPREVVSDPEARYFGGRVEEKSLVPLGEARLGPIGFDEWLRRSQARA